MLEPALALVSEPALRLPIVSIDFEALDASANHLVQTSAALQNWKDLVTTLSVVEGNVLRAEATSSDAASTFLRVVQLPPPAILEDGFENGVGEWTVDDGVWEVGAPNGALAAAFSDENVYATSLTDGYPGQANSSLRSPLLDLAGVTAPRLRFQYFQDMGEEEGVRLDFLDADGNTLLDSDIIFTGNSGVWVEFNRPIPSQARDTSIFVEFRLLTDDDDSNNGFGFALDEVRVTGN